MPSDPDYLLIGHVSQDVILSDAASSGARRYAFGGTVTFAAHTAKAMGQRVAVVTSASAEFALGAALPDIATVCLPSSETTTFENRYFDGRRVQILSAVAETLSIAAVPQEWRRPTIAHLAPVADEVDVQLIDAFPGVFIGVTPQGWLRQWDETGRVSPKPWTEARALLSRVNALVMSEEDASGDWELIRAWARLTSVLVVTQGAQGATMFIGGEPCHVPAPSVQEVDPTGAGDIFAAAFFVRLRQSNDPHEAARVATCLASQSVTRRGLDSVATLDQVENLKFKISNLKTPGLK